MNEPLINPWLFYLIDVCCSLKVICIVATVLSGVFAAISFLESDTYNAEKYERYIKFAKKGTYCLVASCLLIITIPSPETIYKMMLAQYITKANIVATGETIDTVLDKAVEKIIKIKGSK